MKCVASDRVKGAIAAEEIAQAKTVWEAAVQYSSFPDVFEALKHQTSHPLVRQLGLQLDKNGVLRCHGRLSNADLSFDAINPKLLPSKHAFTNLVVQSVHRRLLHTGVPHTLSQLRLEYWVPKGRTVVKHVLLKCQVCRRHEGGAFKIPAMPSLPNARVLPAHVLGPSNVPETR